LQWLKCLGDVTLISGDEVLRQFPSRRAAAFERRSCGREDYELCYLPRLPGEATCRRCTHKWIMFAEMPNIDPMGRLQTGLDCVIIQS
jgi:hypothetical protein